MGGLIVGTILILIGISVLTGIPVFGFIFAVVLILVGIRIITGRSWHDSWHWHNHDHGAIESGEDRIDEVAVFSPLNKSYTTEHFKGGKIVAVFSGAEIDLTQVKTDATEIALEVSSVFSGVEIVVPKDWNVKSAANVFLGNVDIHQAHGTTGSVTLTIHGEAAFGGIEVRK